MTQLRFIPTTFAASAALFAAMLAPLPAHALLAEPGCTANTDCLKGFECTVVGTSGCAPTPTCAPGASCPEPEPCETTVQKACTPAHCQADADCADGMVCFDFPSTNCATTDCACAPDSPDCGCAAVPACDPQPNKMCAPRYVLPCTAAADCGEGFTCEEQLSCGCSGSGGGEPGAPQPGSAPKPAGNADAAPPEDCSCQATGEMRCMPKDIACTVPADCPMGWSCVTESVDIADPAPCVEGNCGSGAAAPRPLPRSVCQPEYYSGGVSGGDDSGTPTKGEEGSGDGSGTDNGGTTPPRADGSGESNESAACQMGHAPASRSVLSLMVVLGAALGLKRRRR